MNALEQLREEHKAVKLVIQILRKIQKKIKAGQEFEAGDLEKIVEFIKVFVDKCHHGKEEDLLFPAMEKAGVPKEGGPIGMMLLEHDQGRKYVKGMSESLEEYRVGDQKALKKLDENIEGYNNLLTEHIDKEDNILYMIAEMHLEPEQQKELSSGFDNIETERIGAGKHEEFHRMLEKLKKTYLH